MTMPQVQLPRRPAVGWIYDLIVKTFSFMVALFFREIQVQGLWRVPREGSLILVAAPHANQFVDSVILMRILRSVDRRISWLMAEKSFARPFIGSLASAIGALPVSRAMDIARPGRGAVFLPEPCTDPKFLRGIGTDFTASDFETGGSLYLPTINGESHKLDISEIYGPDVIILKTAPSSIDTFFQLTGKRDLTEETPPEFRGSEFKVAPRVDQTRVYSAVFERLQTGGCIGIFPEGGSHDRTSLLPLKAGIAIMALGALAQNAPVSIVPVGLTYFSAPKFRSRAAIEFGESIPVEPALVKEFNDGKKREAIGTLMSDISRALAAVTVSAPDFETLMAIHCAQRLYLTNSPSNISKSKLSLPLKTELNRRLLKGYTTYSNRAEMISLMRNLRSYMTSLAALGLADHQLLSITTKHTHFPILFLLPKLMYRILKITFLAIITLPGRYWRRIPIAFWKFSGDALKTMPQFSRSNLYRAIADSAFTTGLILFAPIFIITSRISKRKKAEALAASSVKIYGHDVVATWKILVAAGVAPLFYTFYTLLFLALNKHNHIYGYIPASTPTWVIVLSSYTILSMITYGSLLFGEESLDILKSLYPLVLSITPWSSHMIEALKEERRVLVLQVKEAVDQFGTEIFPDCEDISKWKGRGPRKLYAEISPEANLGDLGGLDEFV